jgi:hypothetical protein
MILIFRRMVILSVAFISATTLGGQELVQTKGVGIAESKSKACELGLDQARREAAQQATSMVEASFTSIENDKGVAHRSDQLVTTKAFAKLVDKTEKALFNDETGHISCEVTASFKAGFVNQDVENIKRTDQTEISTSDFKAGEPFCSKVMGLCFREIYSKQLGEFGIQVLPTKDGSLGSNSGFFPRNFEGAFFNEVYAPWGDPLSYQVIKVDTKEKMIQVLKNKKEEMNEQTWLLLKAYVLDQRRGFVRMPLTSYDNDFNELISLNRRKIPLFTPKVSKDYVSALDEKMKLIQENLDSMY